MKNFINPTLRQHRLISYKLTSVWMQRVGCKKVAEYQKQWLDGYQSVVISDFYVTICGVFGKELDNSIKAFFDTAVFFFDSSSIYYRKTKDNDLVQIYNIKNEIERWLTH